ncbi:sensor histidine kinase [Sphingomonas fuzhouensis]|uniref:sensor histidine kinase n=1 Tax=Sphingomonas fuzhouensis TaxID=3106033 RepID=UPI002AFE0EE0|nr:HAMP domain-containing sensor histidine kinase [Sphingomonas sp. SGZ-02]
MRFARLFRSLSGRIALLLSLGTVLAVVFALLVAGQIRRSDYRRLQSERVLASAADIVERFRQDPRGTLRVMTNQGIIGAVIVAPYAALPPADQRLTARLAQRIGPGTPVRLSPASDALCHTTDPFWHRSRAAGFGAFPASDCWLLTIAPASGRVTVGLDLPYLLPPPTLLSDLPFLALIALACILPSAIAARFATRPLRRLTSASRAFAGSIDADPVPETGPVDVREALATFNVMQERVRAGLRERTHLLAAISHDLQTPLTRLRLRLEQVQDEALRARLIGDLSATLRMVRRGLDLARSAESGEEWSIVDLGSLLSSLADDAVDMGHSVTYRGEPTLRLRVKPDALTRCLTNLVDNAVRYADGAELSWTQHDPYIVISVCDRGPGMPDAMLSRAFEPFFRGDVGVKGGSGIGLAIARAQAATMDGEVVLERRAGGGLCACVRLPIASIRG